MCGIGGVFIFQNNSFQLTTSWLTQMRDTMTHRGPDGEGLWISPNKQVGFAHRRLAIIDPEHAHQPMSNEQKTVWLVFNGEIYNHAQIRLELEQTKKYQWKTNHSDTEVLLHAFEEWGINCLHKFRGMFAFALWDKSKEELWLVRDRIGIKPLYYSIHHGRIIFASEIKALLTDPQQQRNLDEEAFFHYLSFLTTPAPYTLFKGIKKLPGGHWLKIDTAGKVTTKRYWDVWDHVSPLEYQEETITNNVLESLQQAVEYRKVSDVPVGVFLSGGIDSAANTALFSKQGKLKVKTFSIGYDRDYSSYHNELQYARLMAQYVNADHYEKILSVDDLLNFLPQMVYLQDEPIADPVCVPIYYLAKLARDNNVIVCQVGEGADELFWGYHSWKIFLRLQQLNSLPCPSFVKKMGLAFLSSLGKSNTLYYEFLRRGSLKQPVFWGGAEAFTQKQKERLLTPHLRQKFSGRTSWEVLEPLWQNFQKKAWEKSHLHWMTYLDLNLRLPELLLMRVDKMCMGASVEGRVPFLDHKFVELALSISQNAKTKNGNLKYILKKSVQEFIPGELIGRKKQGFGIPLHEWFMGKLGNVVGKELEDFCRNTGLFEIKEIHYLLRTKQERQVWYLFNFALWWNQHFSS